MAGTALQRRSIAPPVRLAVLSALAAALGLSACVHPYALPSAAAACPRGGALMARYELYFGATRPDGAPITDAEWRAFLDAEVTPRFPDGLSVLELYGQWRGPDGIVVREPSRALLVWAPPSEAADAGLEAIRDAFERAFDQRSVMRVDGGEDCVSF